MAPSRLIVATVALAAFSLKLAAAVPKSRFNRPIKDEQLEKVRGGGVARLGGAAVARDTCAAACRAGVG